VPHQTQLPSPGSSRQEMPCEAQGTITYIIEITTDIKELEGGLLNE
jgi:hypothetical protein